MNDPFAPLPDVDEHSLEFARWRRQYVAHEREPVDEGGDVLARVWCPKCGKRVGIAWRHPEFGLLLETLDRFRPKFNESARWMDRRWLVILSSTPTVTDDPDEVSATCRSGHRLSVSCRDVAVAVMAGVDRCTASLV